MFKRHSTAPINTQRAWLILAPTNRVWTFSQSAVNHPSDKISKTTSIQINMDAIHQILITPEWLNGSYEFGEDFKHEPVPPQADTGNQPQAQTKLPTRVDFKRYATSIDEIENNCRIIFRQRDKKFDEERRRRNRLRLAARAQAGDKGFRKPRQVVEPRLPRLEDHYVKRLERVLVLVFQMVDRGYADCLWNFGSDWLNVERGILHLMFANRLHEDLIVSIQSLDATLRFWPPEWYNEISLLWYHSQYTFHRKSYEHLTPVDTFRIRKRYPCPTQRFLGKTKYSLPMTALKLLKDTYQENTKPSRSTKLTLSKETGLTMETINNWFKNKRQRDSRSKASQSQNGSSSGSESYVCEPSQEIYISADPCYVDPLITDYYYQEEPQSSCLQYDQYNQYWSCYAPFGPEAGEFCM